MYELLAGWAEGPFDAPADIHSDVIALRIARNEAQSPGNGEAIRKRDHHASAILSAGLRKRVGCTARDLRTGTAPSEASYIGLTCRVLMHLGATWPAGISVCNRCGMIFEHPRSSERKRCDLCHRNPRGDAPSVTIVGDNGQKVQLPSLATVLARYPECEHCGTVFYASRNDARTCGDRCRQAVARGQAPPPERVRREHLLADQARLFARFPELRGR